MFRFSVFYIVFLAIFTSAASVPRWKLHIKGSKVFSEKFLIEQLDLPEEMDVILPERRAFIINLAKTNLDDFYQSNGYFSEKTSLAVSEELIDTTKVEVYTFDVFEGEKYKFSEAKIIFIGKGDTLIKAENFLVAKGGFYDPEYISNDKRNIMDIYMKNGYLHIAVEHIEAIDTIAEKVNVIYSIEPKYKVRMGNFRSKFFRSGLMPGQTEPEIGLSDTTWVSKLWEIPRDSIVNDRYYFSFRTKLFSTQLFSQVQLEDTLSEDGLLSDITLTAYERAPGEANYGFFFEQLYGFGISLSSLHRNLFGSFHEAGISTMLAENRQELSFSYANPLLFGTRVSWIHTAIRLDEKIFFNHEKIPAPINPDSLVERWEIVNRAILSFGLSNRLRTRNTLDFKFLKLQGEDYFKIKGEIGLTYDRTDNNYDPRKGFRLAPSFGAGGELQHESFNKMKNIEKLAEFWNISLEHGFLYTDMSAFVYFPILRRLLSAFAFSYGKVFNRAAQDDAQIFYQGGSRTLRGYRFRSVFPKKMDIIYDEDGDILDTVIVQSLSPRYLRINEEFRIIPPWSFLRNWQLVQFTDWVRINDRDKSLSEEREMSVGLGIRYKWQFLTFRLDYALKTEFKDFKVNEFKFSHIVFDLSQAI